MVARLQDSEGGPLAPGELLSRSQADTLGPRRAQEKGPQGHGLRAHGDFNAENGDGEAVGLEGAPASVVVSRAG